MDPSPPLELAHENCVSGANEQNDICFLGIKDDPEQFGFATGVFDMDETAICADKFSGDFSGTRDAKFYWYLDTDGNQTNSCSPDDDGSLEGFEFKFKYETKIQDGDFVETKVAYKCLLGIWSPSQIKITAWSEKMCYMPIGGVVAISKEDIDKLKVLGLFNDSEDMRIYATTADSTGTDSDVYDTIGPIWYSHGSADFKFEDCMGFVDMDGDGLLPEEDPDCTNFLRYGFIQLEQGIDCNDSIDNDGNGLVDCDDPSCMYDAYYCDAPDDNTAPTITWMNVETFMEGAFLDIKTNEPTNATLIFYRDDSYCSNESAAITILDWKMENEFSMDDYDFWHGLPCDQMYFDYESDDSYDFESNTTYYYKTRLCDKSDNCALSACSSFTTETSIKNFTVGFTLPPPIGPHTDLMGMMNAKFDWDGDGVFDETIDGDTGYRINETQGRDVDLKFTNPNATNEWSIDFKGVDFTKAQSLNITDAFVINETSEGDIFVGMKKDKWKEMAQKLGVDYVSIVIPQGIDTANYVGGLKHCPDNATTVDDSRCLNINMSTINCTFTSSQTICDIPTSIGFSVFAVYMAETITHDSSNNDGGSVGSVSGGGVAINRGVAKSWASLPPGKKASMTLKKSDIPLTSISFKAKVQLINSKLEVFARSESEMPAKAAKNVYKYMEISKTNMDNADVSDIEMQFKVQKSWMNELGLKNSDVVLMRYTNKWSEIKTSVVSESDSDVTYKAELPGFSYFAVAAKETVQEEAVTETIEETAEEIIGETPEEETDIEEVQISEEKEPGKLPIPLLIILTIAIVVVIAFVFLRKKQ